jgi:hypothetical protein
MSTSTGLPRRLPQPLDQPVPPVKVNERNLFSVRVNSTNELLVQNEVINIRELRAKAKEFIKNENNSSNFPEKVTMNIPLLGTMEVTKDHVISLMNDVDTQYQAYISVQNELVAAYNELRNELSTQKFGKLFSELSEDEQKAVQTVYPLKISEAEPKKVGGGK